MNVYFSCPRCNKLEGFTKSENLWRGISRMLDGKPDTEWESGFWLLSSLVRERKNSTPIECNHCGYLTTIEKFKEAKP
tara:strand:+ start:43 stop:276 length:234 start_codon:yes stop_codon:yes gene_type:complete